MKKHQMKEKEKQVDEEEISIENVGELKKEVNKLVFDTNKILTLNENNIFVAGISFQNSNFTIILTSSPLTNYIQQSKYAHKFLCFDGTYKLNDTKYPTIIVGIVDRERKSHSSKYYFNILQNF